MAVKHLQLNLAKIYGFLKLYAEEEAVYEDFQAEARKLDKPITDEDDDDDFHLCTHTLGEEDIEKGVQLLRLIPMTAAQVCARKLPSYEGHRRDFLFINGIDAVYRHSPAIAAAVAQGHLRNFEMLDEEGLAWPVSNIPERIADCQDYGKESLAGSHDTQSSKQHGRPVEQNGDIEMSDASSYDAGEDPMWVEATDTFFDLPELRGPPPDVKLPSPDVKLAGHQFLPFVEEPALNAFKRAKDQMDEHMRQEQVSGQDSERSCPPVATERNLPALNFLGGAPGELTRPMLVDTNDRRLFGEELRNRWREFSNWYWAQIDHSRGTNHLPLDASPRLNASESQNQILEGAAQRFSIWYLEQIEHLARMPKQFKALRTEPVAEVTGHDEEWKTWINWPPSPEPHDGDYIGAGAHDVPADPIPSPQMAVTPVRQSGLSLGTPHGDRVLQRGFVNPAQFLISPIRQPGQNTDTSPGGRMLQPSPGPHLPLWLISPARPPAQSNGASPGGPGRRTYNPWELALARGRAIQIAQKRQQRAAARSGPPAAPQPSRREPVEAPPRDTFLEGSIADARKWVRNHGLWEWASGERKAWAARQKKIWDQEDAEAQAERDAEFNPNDMFKERNSLAKGLFPSDEEENSEMTASVQRQPSQVTVAPMSGSDQVHRKEKQSYNKKRTAGPQAPGVQGRTQYGSEVSEDEESGTNVARPRAPAQDPGPFWPAREKRAQEEAIQEAPTPRRRGGRQKVILDDDDAISSPPSSEKYQLLESDEEYEAVYIPVNESGDDDFDPFVSKPKSGRRNRKGEERWRPRPPKQVAFADPHEITLPAVDPNAASASCTAAPEPTVVHSPVLVRKALISAAEPETAQLPQMTSSGQAARGQATANPLLNKMGQPYKRGPYKPYKKKANKKTNATQGVQANGTPSAGADIPVSVPAMSQPADGEEPASEKGGKTYALPSMPQPTMSNSFISHLPGRKVTPVPLPIIPGFTMPSLSMDPLKDNHRADDRYAYQKAATVHSTGVQAFDPGVQQNNLTLRSPIMTADEFGTASSRGTVRQRIMDYHHPEVQSTPGESQFSGTHSALGRVHGGLATTQPGSVPSIEGYPIIKQVSYPRPEGFNLSSTTTGVPRGPQPTGKNIVHQQGALRFPRVMPGRRPTEILVGYWKASGQQDIADKHGVFGVLGTGTGSPFRIKVGKQTRDGRPLGKETMPPGPGKVWLNSSDCEREHYLRDLDREELREFVRVRQWQKDHGEADDEVPANILVAVDEARRRVVHIPWHIRTALNAEDPMIAAGERQSRPGRKRKGPIAKTTENIAGPVVPGDDVGAQVPPSPAPEEPAMMASAPPAARGSFSHPTTESKGPVIPRDDTIAQMSSVPPPKKRRRSPKKPSVAAESVGPVNTGSDVGAQMSPAPAPQTPAVPTVVKRGRGRPRKHPVLAYAPQGVPLVATGVVQSSANTTQAPVLSSSSSLLAGAQTPSRTEEASPMPMPQLHAQGRGKSVAALQRFQNTHVYSQSASSPIGVGSPAVASPTSSQRHGEDDDVTDDDEPMRWKYRQFKRPKLSHSK